MTQPVILDLFCGAGGAAMGYHRAGFDVIGVDINPQPNYPFYFEQADAIEYLAEAPDRIFPFVDAIHASPPCQHYAGVTAWRGSREDHPDLIEPTRGRLLATGLPYVIENVPDARRHLINPIKLCGSMFGIKVRRHRYFEANWPLDILTVGCNHHLPALPFEHKAERAYADAMGCSWMSAVEARQAIPPAYTEHIGHQLMAQIERTRCGSKADAA